MTSVAGKVLCMCGHARAVHYDTGAWRNCCATGCACLNFQSAESFERAGPSRQPAPLAQPTPPRETSGSPPSPTICRKCGFDPSRLHCPNCGAVVTVEREHFRTAPCLGSDGPVPHWSCD